MASRLVLQDKFVSLTVKHSDGSVMIQGYMSAAGRGELLFIEGTMIARISCDLLRQILTSFLR